MDVKLDDGDTTLYVEPSLEEDRAVYVLLKDVARFIVDSTGRPWAAKDGLWVKYEDYEQLRQQWEEAVKRMSGTHEPREGLLPYCEHGAHAGNCPHTTCHHAKHLRTT